MCLTSSLTVGGAELVISNLARQLDAQRFDLTVAHLKERGGVGERLAESGVTVVGVPRRSGRLRRYLSFVELLDIVRARRIELINTHTTYALCDAALCRVATGGRLKLVHTFHYGNYPHLPVRYLAMERLGARVADHLVAVGVEQRATLTDLYRLSPSRISTILNGTLLAEQSVDAEWARRLAADGRTVVGTTATFIAQKGLDDLLDVASLVSQRGGNAVFLVVGDGELRQRLEMKRRAMGLEQTVLFAGWKTDAAATMMPLYDVLLQPSHWEAMSMVVLEAMALGKPVVATDVGDNRHVVADGHTGFVVPARDVHAISDRLLRLIESPPLRQAFGAAGKAKHEAHYTAAAMARAYGDLFERVLVGSRQANRSTRAS